MPGICGIVRSSATQPVAELLSEMLQSLRHYPWQRIERGGDEADAALGRVSLGIVNSEPQPAVVADAASFRAEAGSVGHASGASSVAVMDGELLGAEERRRELHAAGHAFESGSHAEILLRGYLAQGKEFLARLDGKFSAAIWDGRSRRLVLANDCFGMKPLYYCNPSGRFLFASEIKALLLDGDVPRTPDRKGLAQFFSFGHLWGEETLYESIRVLPAGAWLTYDADDDRVTVERYHSFTSAADAADRGEMLERLDATFKAAVDRRCNGVPNLGLSLSGGLDARTILGVMDREQAPVTSVCLGIEGSLDHRSARQLAALAGNPYHAYTLNDGFLADFEQHLRQMVRLTDGHYLSQCIVMPTLPFYRELGIRVLLRGHGGELLHMRKAYNFSLDAAGLAIRDESALEGWLHRHLRAYMLDAVDAPLFAGMETADVDALARETLRSALAETAGWDPVLHRAWHLFITQRLRRETAMSLVKIGSFVETRLPYVDKELVSLLLSTPPEWKLDELIQAHILRKRFPDFLDVTNVNTGSRIGAGRLTRKFNYLRMRVLAKLGVKGYQPYERLGLWLRRELRPLVRKVLLGDRCLQRGLFRPDTVRRIVEQHFQHQRNHTFLLMAMMICELGQQMFVDADAATVEEEALCDRTGFEIHS
jgi:asparagine synthase (glutamine-hydrolysing)